MITKESLKEYFKRNSQKLPGFQVFYSLFEIVSSCWAFGHSVKRFISRRLPFMKASRKKLQEAEGACV